MALTLDLTVAPMAVSSTTRRRVVGYTGPASYTTGGETLSPSADLGWGKVFAVFGFISNGTVLIQLFYDLANSKIIMFSDATGVQVPNATDLSGYTGQVEFVGQ